jgi:4-alpha-glucanotransferase
MCRYLKRQTGNDGDAAPLLIRLAWSSAAALAIAPLQDLLNLGKEARMNIPGRSFGNWRWRFTDDMVSESAFQWLRDLTVTSNRFARLPSPLLTEVTT